MRNFFSSAIKTPLQVAYEKSYNDAKNQSLMKTPKNPSLSKAGPASSTTQAEKSAAMNAYAAVARNLMNDPTYAGYAGMRMKNEFKREYGDKSKFITLEDGSEEHISKVRARKKSKSDRVVIDVDADPQDINQYLPIDRHAYNNKLDVSYVSNLNSNALSKPAGPASNTHVKIERALDTESAVTSSSIDLNDDLPFLPDKLTLRRECLRMLKGNDFDKKKLKKLMLVLNTDRVKNEEEKQLYGLICSIALDAPFSGLSTSDTVEAMLDMLE